MQHGAVGASLSRRGFSAGLIGAGLAPLLPAHHAQAQGATPKRGGRVRLALLQQTTGDTFDSARYDKGNDYIRGRAVYSYLTKLNQQGLAEPEVATEWSPNAQATVWRFKFRKDITFSDGKPLTVQDIAYSILRHKDPKIASTAKPIAANIKSVAADGPDGFVIELEAPDADLPIVVGLFQFALIKDGTTDFTKPIGTGGFVMTEFQPGLRTILDRNPNFWKPGQPYIDRLEMFPVPDHAARANALLTGEVELALDVRGTSIQKVEASDVATIFVTPTTRYTAIQAMMDRDPSRNVDLTLAMANLIDRERFLNTVLRGYGRIANDHVVGPDSPLFDPTLPQRKLDLDRAKFHLQKSGMGNTAFEVSVGDAAVYSVEMGQMIQREGQRIGMNMQLRREPAESYWTAVAGQKPYAATNFHARPTLNMLLDLAFRKGAVWNFSHYSNDRLEQLLDQSRAELNLDRRKQQFAEIQRILHDSGAIILPCFQNYIDGMSKKIRGIKPLYIGSLGGFDFADSVWIDG